MDKTIKNEGYPKGAVTKREPPSTKIVKNPFADHIPGLQELPQREDDEADAEGVT